MSRKRRKQKSLLDSDHPDYITGLFKKELAQVQPDLTDERLKELFTLCNDEAATDEARSKAREELILVTIPAVIKAAGKAGRFRKLGFADAIAEGNLAAVKAVDAFLRNYDASKAPLTVAVFVGYIKTPVKRRMSTAQRKAQSVMPMSRHKWDHKWKIERAKRQLASKGQEATPEAISEATGIGPNAVLDTAACDLRVVSLDDAIPGSEDKQGEPVPYIDVVSDPNAPTPEKIVGTADIHTRIRQVLKTQLNQRQYDVLALSFGLDGEEPMTYEQIAEQLGVSVDAIQQVVFRAYAVLRNVQGLEQLYRLLIASDRSYGSHQINNVPLIRQQTPEQRERVNNRKLTPEQVQTIRERSAAGEQGSELAKEFGVARTTIYAAVNGQNWKSVKRTAKREPTLSARAIAITTGALTYEGKPHAKCRTTTKYTNKGVCVHCATQAGISDEARQRNRESQARWRAQRRERG